MFESFTAGARDTIAIHAPAEARRRGDRRVGTEHLLLAVLHDPAAAGPLGLDVENVRSALAALDEAALRAIGIDPRGVERAPVPVPSKRLPLTSGAKAALSRALTTARRTRPRQVTSAHLLIGLLDGDRADPATGVLLELGVDRAAVRAQLLSWPGAEEHRNEK
ncbi:Clp protease N-terminal domain-containing protein [Streptosporangium sp. NPDC023615]|uniref:Clp protease N-terminal domain-containing protein n=1 Tax=Streptosporangium sp. NPDC023615 TaxID=3154794 RepID=UPI003419CF28